MGPEPLPLILVLVVAAIGIAALRSAGARRRRDADLESQRRIAALRKQAAAEREAEEDRSREKGKSLGRKVEMQRQEDGTLIIKPGYEGVFVPDESLAGVRDLVNRLLFDLSPVSGGAIVCSPQPYPSHWEALIQVAVELKRKGEFLEASRIYVGLIREQSLAHTAMLFFLYKTVACAGYLAGGAALLKHAQRGYLQDPDEMAVQHGIPSAYEDHLDRLAASSREQASLEIYLRDISGSVGYRIPFSYEEVVGELTIGMP